MMTGIFCFCLPLVMQSVTKGRKKLNHFCADFCKNVRDIGISSDLCAVEITGSAIRILIISGYSAHRH